MHRVVLDTNIVLSALLFTSGRLAWIRHAWQGQQLQPLVCRETVNELLRVLAYPKFNLTANEQKELLADFLPYADVVELPKPWPDLPVCRDEKDQVFLVLAQTGHADILVTGDADLLAMRDEFPGLMLTADELAQAQRADVTQPARAKRPTARKPRRAT
ncbi:putative toxin-antitoxin system toxin component, PIN family [Bordetella genomosp. 8]|uniref:Putative toxin-antitoxin system toxin component, PIN family n=1 Tax=Bordetella genomosp. 8 TaxID=1416806 RepID=A0A1W6YT73_9BORD|nr:putative toxin-antitoxin system toxin component, PIN family [Bordetella genomosp. 8]ARP84295.1 putative toxin-antitoxin system toxin component, PIN family [Bordetella genomosp. 8]